MEEGGTIGWDFLGECGNLQSTEESPISLSPLAKVTNIGEGFMYNCHKIEYLDFSSLTSLTTANSFGAGICFGCEKLKSINIGTLSADIFEADVTTQGQEAINFALSTRPAESYAGITVNGDNKAAFIAKFPVKDGPSIWRKLVTAE